MFSSQTFCSPLGPGQSLGVEMCCVFHCGLVLPAAAFLLATGPVLSKAVSRYPGLACRGLGSAALHLVLTWPGVDVPGKDGDNTPRALVQTVKDLAGWERINQEEL